MTSVRPTARPWPRPALRVAAAVLTCLLALPAAQARSRGDHEWAQEAVKSGEILPLNSVLERLAKEHPGQVLEVELERIEDGWAYEVKMLQPDGQLVKLIVDARTAAVLLRRSRPTTSPFGHH